MLVMICLPSDTPATMRRILIIIVVSLLAVVYLANVTAATIVPSSWSAPTAKTVKRVSTIPGAQHAPNYMSNLDCQTITYRLVNRNAMQTGCFTPTAFGLFDVGSQTVIYNGTDEGLPLNTYSPHQILVPWQSAGNLIALDTLNTGGSYISLYKNPLRYLQDEFNASGQLTAKRLTEPPEIRLTDRNGQRLVINAQTVTVSDGGGWLVAETLNGSFVRINLTSLDVVSFAPSFGSQGSPGLLMSQIGVSEDGRTVAIYNSAADSFKVYDLSSCTGMCPNYDYQPHIRSQVSGLRYIRQVRFINNNLLSFEATTNTPANDGVYLLAPSASIQSLTDYVALGDSYTSGEGAFNYIAGTDTEDNRCHLSINSYPMLLTRDLFSQAGGHSVACSGAVIKDLASDDDSYVGQVRNVHNLAGLKSGEAQLLESVESNYIPGYVAQHRFVKRWQPKIITVSVGGNDIGFGEILKQCVVPKVSFSDNEQDCFASYEDRREILDLIDKTIPRWASLYKQLQKQSPESKIYSIGYPELADENGNCAINVHLSKKEIGFSTELVTYLNNAIQKASADANVNYVDISKALAGYRLCETASHNVAVNGLTAGTDKYILGSESYHPNALGHSLIEQAILNKTNNLRQQTTPPMPADTNTLLNVPKSGRAINNRQFQKITEEVMHRWNSPALRVTGSMLKAFSNYEIRLDGSVLGSATTDEEGNITGNFPMWSGASDGLHIIDVKGETQTGESITIFQPIYVPRYDYDFDGDDKHNDVDSCIWAINSNQDQDRDGVDDVCDAIIGTAPATTPPQTTPQSPTGQPGSPSPSQPQNPSSTPQTPTLQPTSNVIGTFSTTGSNSVGNRSSGQSSRIVAAGANPRTINPQAVKGAKIIKPVKMLPQTYKPIAHNPVALTWHWIGYSIIVIWITILLLLWLPNKLGMGRKSSTMQTYST